MLKFDIDQYILNQQFLIKDIVDEKTKNLFITENALIKEMLQQLDLEMLKIILPIITNEKFIQTRTHLHHDNISTYFHMLHVSFFAYNISKLKKVNPIIPTQAGLLHDFYLYDWHITKQKKNGIFNMHLFSHPIIAAKNAKKYFPELYNNKIENAILSHSWHAYIIKKLFHPFSFQLRKHLPLYKESRIVSIADIKASGYSCRNPKMIWNSLGFEKFYNSTKYYAIKYYSLFIFISFFR